MRIFIVVIWMICLSISNINPTKPTLNLLPLAGNLGQQYPWQFSSLAIVGDRLFVGTEKCNKIYILSRNSFQLIDSIDLRGSIGGLEGMAVYRSRYLFLLDESDPAVYRLDLQRMNDSPNRVTQARDFEHTDKGLLEGIAVNEEANMCYIVTENKGTIYTFNIDSNFMLAKETAFTDTIPDYCGWTRYTDMWFGMDSLFVLKTNYTTKTLFDKIKYQLQCFKINSNGRPDFQQSTSYDLSHCKNNELRNHYDSNLEGIARYADTFYIISDNLVGDMTCNRFNRSLKHSIFFSFKVSG